MVVNTNIAPKQGHSGRLQLLQLRYNSCKRISEARVRAVFSVQLPHVQIQYL